MTGKTTPCTEEEGVDDNANNIVDRLHIEKDQSISPDRGKGRRLRYSKRERRKWKHFKDDKEQVRVYIC